MKARLGEIYQDMHVTSLKTVPADSELPKFVFSNNLIYTALTNSSGGYRDGPLVAAAIALLFAMIFAAVRVPAQTLGEITGQITDSSGAAVRRPRLHSRKPIPTRCAGRLSTAGGRL